MKKNFILIGIVSIFVMLGVIYGFTVVGFPQDSRAIKFDGIRRNNLMSIKNKIEYYHSSNNKLPKNIKDAVNDDKYVEILDPETNKPYEYFITDSKSYKLCAIFKTKYPLSDSINYTVYDNSENFYHEKGYKCFELNIKTNQFNYNHPTITPQPVVVLADDKIQNVTTTSPYDQSSRFPEGFFTTKTDEYGLVNLKNQNVYVTVSFKSPVKLTQITNTIAKCEIASCDPYNGVNLINIEGESEDYQRISLANNLKIAENETVINIPVTTDKEFNRITFRVFGPIIWKKLKFVYK